MPDEPRDQTQGVQAPALVTRGEVEELIGSAVTPLQKQLEQSLSGLSALTKNVEQVMEAVTQPEPEAAAAAEDDEPESGPESTPTGDPKQNARIAELERNLKTESKNREALAKQHEEAVAGQRAAEKKSAIDSLMSTVAAETGREFVSGQSRELLRSFLDGQITRNEAGEYLAGDTTAEGFARDALTGDYSFVLKASEARGSGAVGGDPLGSKAPMIEDIGPDMTDEAEAAAWQAVADNGGM